MTSVYLIGSLRNPAVPELGNFLRSKGLDVFDDWYAAGERADDAWQAYEQGRGRTYAEALAGYACQNVVAFDRTHLDRCDAAVLVAPAGKSAHLELGRQHGRGKRCFVLFDAEPERWDAMYAETPGAESVYFDRQKLIAALVAPQQKRICGWLMYGSRNYYHCGLLLGHGGCHQVLD